ncbi:MULTISPECIES: nitrate- and nitrite sensing domain-containing protein [unclassified Streptomyces]|uniref:sensor histidine kinase n=1 Tax=unclassified Streptomyces TaxID=2593676 RepID=UPI0037F37DD5
MLIVVLVPLLAALGFAGMRVKDALDTADQYRSTAQIARTSRTGTSLIRALAQERDLAVDPQARERLHPSDGDGRAETDAKAKQFLHELTELPASSGMERQYKVTSAGLDALQTIRKLADSHSAPSDVENQYGGVIVPIASLYNQVGGIGEQARGAGWTLYTLALNDVMVTSQRSVLSSTMPSGTLSTGAQGNVLSSQLVRDITGTEFGLYAEPTEAAAFQKIVGAAPSATVTEAVQKLGTSTGQVNLNKVLPKSWYEDLTRVSTQLDQLQDTVESRVLASALKQKDQARQKAVISIALSVLALLLATVLVMATSRHLVRGLTWLRRSAVKVADVHLPDVTRHLSQGSELPRALEGKVLAPRSRDEIGDVARAFDRVYLEAVRLARQQAGTREEVNLLFQNLSRRNQSLIQRQLAVITELESRELEPEELSHLFHLDHLATQIRRNSENLLVLAGAEITSERRETTDLLALIRTAASEIEDYQRVTYHALPPVGVVGYAADDLVHLIAELLDNAASFSSPDTWVVVSGRRMPDGRVLLEIRDAGIGMGSEQLARAEQALQQPAGCRSDLSESMGLYVVGALARKHQVAVRLYENTPTGLVAALILPQSMLAQVGGTPLTTQGATPVSARGAATVAGRGAAPAVSRSTPGSGLASAPVAGSPSAPASGAISVPPSSLALASAPMERAPQRHRHGHARGVMRTRPQPPQAIERPADPAQDQPTVSMRAIGATTGAEASAVDPAAGTGQASPGGPTASPQASPQPGGGAAESTRAGLPVRQRRARVGSISPPGPAGGDAAAFPDPAEIRRRMSGLTDGIAQAEPEQEDPRVRD